MTESPNIAPSPLAKRFRGYLPVVVDVETGGFDWNRHALLEIAVVPIDLDADGAFVMGETASAHLVPAPGTDIDPKSLEITGIVLDHPFRLAKPEKVLSVTVTFGIPSVSTAVLPFVNSHLLTTRLFAWAIFPSTFRRMQYVSLGLSVMLNLQLSNLTLLMSVFP